MITQTHDIVKINIKKIFFHNYSKFFACRKQPTSRSMQKLLMSWQNMQDQYVKSCMKTGPSSWMHF